MPWAPSKGRLSPRTAWKSNKTTGKPFRVWRLGRQKLDQQTVGRLLLDADLTDASGIPLTARHLHLHFLRGVAETGSAPPPDLGAIRQEVRQDIREDRQELKQLNHIEVPMNGQFVDGYGYSLRCFGRGELIRPTKYLNRLMRAWAASRHR